VVLSTPSLANKRDPAEVSKVSKVPLIYDWVERMMYRCECLPWLSQLRLNYSVIEVPIRLLRLYHLTTVRDSRYSIFDQIRKSSCSDIGHIETVSTGANPSRSSRCPNAYIGHMNPRVPIDEIWGPGNVLAILSSTQSESLQETSITSLWEQ
jgi:hypothetical protein